MTAKEKYQEYFKPTVVLTLICLIVTGALAFTFGITDPIIKENNAKAADATRVAVLQAADRFTPYEGELDEGVLDVYLADNKAGVVITAQGKGFGGMLTVMVGLDPSGAVTGLKVTEHSETPGVGTKDMTDEHLALYLGHTAGDVDGVTGATKSANGINQAVNRAIAQFQKLGGAF